MQQLFVANNLGMLLTTVSIDGTKTSTSNITLSEYSIKPVFELRVCGESTVTARQMAVIIANTIAVIGGLDNVDNKCSTMSEDKLAIVHIPMENHTEELQAKFNTVAKLAMKQLKIDDIIYFD